VKVRAKRGTADGGGEVDPHGEAIYFADDLSANRVTEPVSVCSVISRTWQPTGL